MADKEIPYALRKVLSEPIEVPRLEELVSHFFKAAGGPKEMAKILYTEFLAAPSGSQIRQRILEMMIRATTNANKMSPSDGDLSLLSEEDLHRMGLKLMSELPNERAEHTRPFGQADEKAGAAPAETERGADADNAGAARPGVVCEDAGGAEAGSTDPRTGDVRP